MIKRIVYAIILFVATKNYTIAQSLIAGIPSADVAPDGHFEFTHETQLNTWTYSKPKWNSFNFLCYGIGNNTELTANLINLDNAGNRNLATAIGFKKFEVIERSKELRFTYGANLMYGTRHNDLGYWLYSHLSTRLPKYKTRFTAGLSYGTQQQFGYKMMMVDGKMTEQPNKPFIFMGGIEQPITSNIGLITDYMSGTHDIAAWISGVQLTYHHQVLILAYKKPNNPASGDNALIIEFMLNF